MRELPRGSFSSGSLTSQGSMGDVHTSEEGHSQAQAGQLLPEALRAVLAVLVSQYSQDKTRLPSEACAALPCMVWDLQTPAALCSAVSLTICLPMK